MQKNNLTDNEQTTTSFRTLHVAYFFFLFLPE